MLKALQFMESFLTEEEAHKSFKWLQTQVGYLGGRILEPSGAKPGWRVQVFFVKENAKGGWLPDGMQEVMIPESLMAALGL